MQTVFLCWKKRSNWTWFQTSSVVVGMKPASWDLTLDKEKKRFLFSSSTSASGSSGRNKI
jgi:hypothetical protein